MANSVPRSDVVHVPEARRFELRIGGAVAVAEYERGEGTLVCTHTFVPPELRGRAARLQAEDAADNRARMQNYRFGESPAAEQATAAAEPAPERKPRGRARLMAALLVLAIVGAGVYAVMQRNQRFADRKSTRLNSSH